MTNNIVIFEKLRQKIAGLILRSKAAKLKRQKKLSDFASAKHIGLLCAPQNETDVAHIKNFLQYLSQKGIQYAVLGYFDTNAIPENFLYRENIDAFTRMDLDLFFIPRNPAVDKFIREPFDILIRCSIDDCFQLKYIAQLSAAKYKVDIMRKQESYCDLMIDVSKNRTIEYYLKNLEIYLSNLKNP